jgi:hypothetical protein
VSVLARRSRETGAAALAGPTSPAALAAHGPGAGRRTADRRRQRAWLLAPVALAAALALAYVLLAPNSSDLAAAGYRSELFSRDGFTLWDNGWYGGHHLLAYSLLAPALGSLLGTQPLGALATVLAVVLFGALLDGRFSPRATRAATLWFALGASISLLANRLPFELGVAVGLASLLAAQRARGRRPPCALALALAALSALASPVAGAFVGLAALAWAVARLIARAPSRSLVLPAALALAALAPVVLLAVAFPEGGAQPFVASAFWPPLAVVLVLALALAPRERLLRTGTLLYALALIAAYAIPTAVGGNADRLGALFAGPLLACALIDRGASGARRDWRAWALLALAPALLYWQLRAPIADTISAASDPAAKRSFFAPLLGELRRLDAGYGAHATRVEVVPTREHGEARWVAAQVMLARGWERQLDTERNALFYSGATALTPARYRAWLAQNAISYVALADAPLDYSGRAEARLLDGARPYLREVWRSPNWRLFAVRSPTALAQRPSVLTDLTSDSFTLGAPRAGTYEVRVRFTPYWALASAHGCVSRAPGAGEWTDVSTPARGVLRVVIDFSPARIFEHGARCR